MNIFSSCLDFCENIFNLHFLKNPLDSFLNFVFSRSKNQKESSNDNLNKNDSTESTLNADEHAANIIQKMFRGTIVRNYMSQMQTAAVIIQAYARRMITIQSFVRIKNATIQMQSYMRGALTRSNMAFANHSASLIQCAWRRFNHQMTYRIVLSKVVTIQAWFRASSTSRRFSTHRDACKVIQKMFRGTIVRNHMLQMQTAAVIIQKYARRMITIKSFARIKNATIQMQSYMRGALTRSNMAFANHSASLIQCAWRRFNHQMTYRIFLSKVVTIQAWFRASSTSRRFSTHRDACKVIQKMFRGTIVRNHMLQKSYEKERDENSKQFMKLQSDTQSYEPGPSSFEYPRPLRRASPCSDEREGLNCPCSSEREGHARRFGKVGPISFDWETGENIEEFLEYNKRDLLVIKEQTGKLDREMDNKYELVEESLFNFRSELYILKNKALHAEEDLKVLVVQFIKYASLTKAIDAKYKKLSKLLKSNKKELDLLNEYLHGTDSKISQLLISSNNTTGSNKISGGDAESIQLTAKSNSNGSTKISKGRKSTRVSTGSKNEKSNLSPKKEVLSKEERLQANLRRKDQENKYIKTILKFDEDSSIEKPSSVAEKVKKNDDMVGRLNTANVSEQRRHDQTKENMKNRMRNRIRTRTKLEPKKMISENISSAKETSSKSKGKNIERSKKDSESQIRCNESAIKQSKSSSLNEKENGYFNTDKDKIASTGKKKVTKREALMARLAMSTKERRNQENLEIPTDVQRAVKGHTMKKKNWIMSENYSSENEDTNESDEEHFCSHPKNINETNRKQFSWSTCNSEENYIDDPYAFENDSLEYSHCEYELDLDEDWSSVESLN